MKGKPPDLPREKQAGGWHYSFSLVTARERLRRENVGAEAHPSRGVNHACCTAFLGSIVTMIDAVKDALKGIQ